MTYEYACAACGHQWEAEQSIKDAPLKVCPACSAEAAKRLVSGGTGFLLKGGGWYADGYGSAKSGGNKSSASDKPASGDKGTSSSATTTNASTTSASSKPASEATAKAD